MLHANKHKYSNIIVLTKYLEQCNVSWSSFYQQQWCPKHGQIDTYGQCYENHKRYYIIAKGDLPQLLVYQLLR